MKEKTSIKISLMTFLFVIALIVIGILSYFTFKFYNDKSIESKKVEELTEDITRLTNTLEDVQDKMNVISNVVSNNESKTNTDTKSSNNTKQNTTSNSNKQNNSTSNKEQNTQSNNNSNTSEDIFIGTWHCDKVYENGKEISMMEVFGSSGSGKLTLNQDGTFTNYVTRGNNSEISDKGTYKINKESGYIEFIYEDGSTEKALSDKGQLVLKYGEHDIYLSK